MDRDDALTRLRDAAPRLDLLTSPELTTGYGEDATGVVQGAVPMAVARPLDVAEVADLLRACSREKIKVVPQGGRTGLVRAAVPKEDEVILSLLHLDRLGEPDLDALHVDVGAGATLEAVRGHVAKFGLELPIDFAARSACTIGGMVATNAGGAMAFRYGTMVRRVAGLEFVVPDGRVVRRMPDLPKESAGTDLAGILVGAEGTLAVVTAARLRLIPTPVRRLVALFAVDGLESAIGVVRAIRSLPTLEAVDFVDHQTLDLVIGHRGLRRPTSGSHRAHLVAQFAGDGDLATGLAEAIGTFDREPDVVIADDTSGRAELWAYRELANEAIRTMGAVRKFDVGIPLAAMDAFLTELRTALASSYPEVELFVYGHLGDGNLHVNLVGPGSSSMDDLVIRLAVRYGGSISAEHGIGLAKRRWLHLVRSPAEIEFLRGLKRTFDPGSILSPGRLLPD